MSKKIKPNSRKYIAVAAAALLIAAAMGLYAWHRSNINQPTIPSTNPLSDNPSSATSQSNGADQSSPSSGASSSPSASQSGPPPLTPSGNFVSNHHPGGSAPTSEASTCNTSPGAICYIKFTNGSAVRQLSSETANARGAAIWYWDIRDAGLSAGSWTVTAVATLNGQTRTANDAANLVMQ
jgi:hypothetical protein